jgi:hypothetical protein
VLYEVHFTARRQTVTALVDATTVSGLGARRMNMVQAVIDAIAIVTQLPVGTAFHFGYEVYPEIFQTIASLEHLGKAVDALVGDPPDLSEFELQIEQARQSGEFDALADELERLGWVGIKEGMINSGGIPTELADIIIRNYTSTLTIVLTGQVAGFVIFEAR